MQYKKYKADLLFTGTEMLDDNSVLITDENGIIKDIINEKEAGDDVKIFKGMLSPGFINCHCHLELSHMKGLIEEKIGLVDFVFKVVTQRNFAEDEILNAIAKKEDEMMANGIVAVGDICNNTLTLAQKSKQRLAYYNFIEVSGWLPQVAQQRFDKSKEYFDDFENIQHSTFNIQNSISPHAPYSVSNELWDLISPFFQNKTITIHNQETAFEDELFVKGSGDFIRMYEMMKMDNSFFKPTEKSSVQSVLPKLKNAKNVLLVHNTFITEGDVAFIKYCSKQNNQQFFFCLCINANEYIENALPPVELLYKNNCSITIGTDSLASNWSLNILDEIKKIKQSFPLIPQQTILQWATINGARALQMDGQLGSFTKGKKPGIILIENLVDKEITNTSTIKRII